MRFSSYQIPHFSSLQMAQGPAGPMPQFFSTPPLVFICVHPHPKNTFFAPPLLYTLRCHMSRPHKPPALLPGSEVAIVSPASPAEPDRVARGFAELKRLGYKPRPPASLTPDHFFAGGIPERADQLLDALAAPQARAVFSIRGGYGVSTLLERLPAHPFPAPRILLGYSDLTALQVFLWQTFGWVTFYGPMVAAGFDAGSGSPSGYDRDSFQRALSQAQAGWHLELLGEALVTGSVEGTLLGGCLTMIQSTLGTPWELDTRDSILVLEDVSLKPYQLDRLLLHLKQAGKFHNVRGIILGDFPDSAPAVPGSPSACQVARRVLGDLGVPVVYGVPVGHTDRPMLTLPLGVRARLTALGPGILDILEPAVSP